LDVRRSLPAPLLLIYPLAALALLGEALIGGQVLLPARLLPHFVPWQTLAPPSERLPWDALLWDGMAQHFPWRGFLAESLGKGILPLWNPYQFCGTPFLANGQSAPLYPLHGLLAFPPGAPVAVRMGWLAFVHLTVAGAGMHLWARQWGASPLAATVAGVAYLCSGFALAWLCLPSFLTAGCWLPLGLAALEAALREESTARAARATAGAATAFGLMLLGGHPQIAAYGLMAVALRLTWAGCGALRRRQPNRLGRVAAIAVGSLVPAMSFAAPQWLPALEMARLSHRASPPTEAGYRAYAAYGLPPIHLVGLLVPQAFGLPLRGTYWGAASFAEYAGSIGGIGALLALIGAVAGARAAFPALLTGLALLVALGTPLARLLYFGVPGFASSGAPARVLVLVCLGSALLAGLGADAVLRAFAGEGGVPRRLLVGLAIAMGSLLAGSAWLLAVAAEIGAAPVAQEALALVGRLIVGVLLTGALAGLGARRGWWPKSRAVTGWGAALALFIALEGALTARGVVPFAPASLAYPEVPEIAALREGRVGRIATMNERWSLTEPPRGTIFPPNAALAYRLRDAAGYDSLQLGHYRAFTTRLCRRDGAPIENGNLLLLPVAGLRSPLFPLLGVGQVITAAPDGGWSVSHLPAAQEAYLARTWRSLSDAAALDWLEQRLAHEPIPQSATLAPAAGDGTAAGGRIVADERPSANRRRVRLRADGPGLLVLAEGWAPGWHAVVRGEAGAASAPVLRANVAFQAVRVPAGEVTVELVYAPAAVQAGIFALLVAVAMTIGVAIATTERRAVAER